MNFARQYERILLLCFRELTRLSANKLEPFTDALSGWVNALLRQRLPADWRDRLRTFLAEWEEHRCRVTSDHLYILEDWIEAWAYARRLMPLAADGTEVAPRRGNVYLANAAMHAQARQEPPAHSELATVRMLAIKRGKPARGTPEKNPAVSAPPPPAQKSEPTSVFEKGTEVAGPGPATTKSFQRMVNQALALISPILAQWWTSVNGLVRSRQLGFPSWLRSSSYGRMEGDRPVITVEEHFAAGETAIAIAELARDGAFQQSFGDHRVSRDPREQHKVQRERFRQAAGIAAMLAKAYYAGLASVSSPGSVVVLINDVLEEGLSWQQVFLALPLLPYFKRGARLVLRIVGNGPAREIVLSEQLLRDFALLQDAERTVIVNHAAAASTPEEGLAIIEREVAARGAVPRQKPPLPPPAAKVRATVREGKDTPHPSHVKAADSEARLAQEIHDLPDEAVLQWGKPVTANGPNIISYNLKTKQVTFWDDKFRTQARGIKPSGTFTNPDRMERARREAQDAINTSSLLPEDKEAAMRSIKFNGYQTRTVGSGNASNSTFGDHK